MIGRTLRALAAAIFIVALAAGAASAGGWATITADAGNAPPTEGVETTFGFTVLQHGQTPAGWVEATLVATDGATGQRIEARATGQGPDGHFVATITLPRAGYWTWQVELSDLIVETKPQAMTVAFADGTPPTFDAAALLAAVERSRSELRTELQGEFAGELEALRAEVTSLGSELGASQADARALAEQVGDLSGAAELPGGTTGVPLLAAVAIGALAGAIAGFAVTWLGRQSPLGRTRPVASTN